MVPTYTKNEMIQRLAEIDHDGLQLMQEIFDEEKELYSLADGMEIFMAILARVIELNNKLSD
ncbi:MAG: hypothetical protein V4722_21830 [Bacteroidota bacterium]